MRALAIPRVLRRAVLAALALALGAVPAGATHGIDADGDGIVDVGFDPGLLERHDGLQRVLQRGGARRGGRGGVVYEQIKADIGSSLGFFEQIGSFLFTGTKKKLANQVTKLLRRARLRRRQRHVEARRRLRLQRLAGRPPADAVHAPGHGLRAVGPPRDLRRRRRERPERRGRHPVPARRADAGAGRAPGGDRAGGLVRTGPGGGVAALLQRLAVCATTSTR
jgi:hypothetical protein